MLNDGFITKNCRIFNIASGTAKTQGFLAPKLWVVLYVTPSMRKQSLKSVNAWRREVGKTVNMYVCKCVCFLGADIVDKYVTVL